MKKKSSISPEIFYLCSEKIIVMATLIGRKKEAMLLRKYISSNRPEFIGLYGRRRVGKTFLVNQLLHDQLTFSVSGLLYGKKSEQMAAFQIALRDHGYEKPIGKSWLEMFFALEDLLTGKLRRGKPCVIFIDELPCFDRKGGAFVRALGQFWNTWCSLHDEVKLIVCGSATSWMVRNIINNRGGLYGRLTHTMHLAPFTLKETEAYLKANGFRWTRLMIAQTYMTFGGVPYYLSLLRNDESLAQNIDRLCFSRKGELVAEYEMLYKSLFDNENPYLQIISQLADNKSGLTRVELAENLGVADNGHLTEQLEDLENCDIIRRYYVREKKIKSTGSIFQLIDFFTLFHLTFAAKQFENGQYWQHHLGTPILNTWYGHAFERLCMAHIPQIKKALKIDGIGTEYYSWRSKSKETKTQIDLIIERADRMINVCEIKYSEGQYLLDKEEADNIRVRWTTFVEQTGTQCGIFPTLITTNGTTENSYASEMAFKLTLADLFE